MKIWSDHFKASSKCHSNEVRLQVAIPTIGNVDQAIVNVDICDAMRCDAMHGFLLIDHTNSLFTQIVSNKAIDDCFPLASTMRKAEIGMLILDPFSSNSCETP